MILKHVWSFVRRPEYTPYSRLSTPTRLKIVSSLVLWNFMISMIIGVLTEVVLQIMNVDTGNHQIAELFENYGPLRIFILIVLMAPLIEEVLFRGPLAFFKKSSFLPWAYYISCIAFGAVHFGNYESASSLLLWAPLLVAPQTLMGFFLGFLRIKLGLNYAILMHMGHNGLIFLIFSAIPGT
jgi:membrane protease YdiL (CAAX protease family)